MLSSKDIELSFIDITSTLIFGSRATRLDGSTAAGAAQLADGTFGGVKIDYWHHIVSYTALGNIFLGIVALVSAIIAKKNPGQSLSKKLATWYLVASSSTMLTVLVVIFFLAPMRAMGGKNYFDMLLEQMFFLHFLNPILGAISYIFYLETEEKVTRKSCLLAVLPPVIYSSPYIICVCILKIWPDFYGLTFGGKNFIIPIEYFIVCAVMLVIGSSLIALHNRFSVKSVPESK